MDESLKTLLVVGGTILVAVLVHYFIIKRVASRTRRNATFVSRTINSAKNPWKRESDQLDELSRLVEQVSAPSLVKKDSSDESSSECG